MELARRQAGIGTVSILDGGLIEVGGMLRIWDTSTVTIDGGTLKLDSTTLDLQGTLDFNAGNLHLTDAGGYTVGANNNVIDQRLGGIDVRLFDSRGLIVEETLTVPTGNSITVNGGSVAAAALVNDELVISTNSTLATASGLTNNANMVLVDSTVDGPVNNASGGAITVVGTAQFNGLVSGPGNFFGPGTANFNGGLAIGASPAEVTFEGDVTLASSNTLFIEIGGLLAGDEFDQLSIDGSATLDGTLKVDLISEFSPSVGDTFEILTAASVFDTFVFKDLPDMGGLLWNVNYGAASVVLEVITPFSADFDFDGDVDNDDLAKWQGDYGGQGSDADGDGDSDGADFLAWQRQFGSPGAPGLTPSTTVPEPMTTSMLLIGVFFGNQTRRRAGR